MANQCLHLCGCFTSISAGNPGTSFFQEMEVTFSPLKRSRIKHPSLGHWEEPGSCSCFSLPLSSIGPVQWSRLQPLKPGRKKILKIDQVPGFTRGGTKTSDKWGYNSRSARGSPRPCTGLFGFSTGGYRSIEITQQKYSKTSGVLIGYIYIYNIAICLSTTRRW